MNITLDTVPEFARLYERTGFMINHPASRLDYLCALPKIVHLPITEITLELQTLREDTCIAYDERSMLSAALKIVMVEESAEDETIRYCQDLLGSSSSGVVYYELEQSTNAFYKICEQLHRILKQHQLYCMGIFPYAVEQMYSGILQLIRLDDYNDQLKNELKH